MHSINCFRLTVGSEPESLRIRHLRWMRKLIHPTYYQAKPVNVAPIAGIRTSSQPTCCDIATELSHFGCWSKTASAVLKG